MPVHVKTPHGSRDGRMNDVASWLKVTEIAGGAAGNHTLSGIKVGDQLISVFYEPGTGASSLLTSEFSITADDTINNTGGTDTTGGKLFVQWADLT